MSGSFTLFGHSFSYPLSLLPTETTFTLFEYEYHVPLLPSALAACYGYVATELLLHGVPGFGLENALRRAGAVRVSSIWRSLSYPDRDDAGLAQHQVGLLLSLVMLPRPRQAVPGSSDRSMDPPLTDLTHHTEED